MEYLYSLTIALFLTIATIPLLIRYSARLGLVDEPTAERKMHSQAMPRTGGLGILCGTFWPLVFLLAFDSSTTTLFMGCAVIIFFGLLDDRVELSFGWKLFGQALATMLVMAAGIYFHQFPFLGLGEAPRWLAYPFTFFFLVGVVNGVNFSDGLDGLAAGTSIMALLLIFALALQSGNANVALISLTVVGALLGFLRYNTFPARIFMGDAGSQFLGFIIACLAVIVTQSDSAPFSPLLPILILGIPIMDILQVVPVRIHKKLPLPGPDKEHFHHQLVKLGFRHYEVVAIIYILQTILMAGAFWLRYESDLLIAVFYATFVVVILGSILAANIAGWQFRGKLRHGNGVERRNKLLRRINWLHGYGPGIVAVFLGLFFIVAGCLIHPPTVGPALLVTALGVVVVTAIASRYPQSEIGFRVLLYGCSVMFAYLISQANFSAETEYLVNGFLLVILFLLVLTIRTTRKTEFSLTTQDLLILMVVIIIPLLPFESLNQYSIGRIALTTAVLMYTSEYLLSRAVRTTGIATAGALLGLLIWLYP